MANWTDEVLWISFAQIFSFSHFIFFFDCVCPAKSANICLEKLMARIERAVQTRPLNWKAAVVVVVATAVTANATKSNWCYNFTVHFVGSLDCRAWGSERKWASCSTANGKGPTKCLSESKVVGAQPRSQARLHPSIKRGLMHFSWIDSLFSSHSDFFPLTGQ